MLDLEIAEITENRNRICSDLLRSLPRWFGLESAILKYSADVESMPTFVATIKGDSIGFISLRLRNEWTAEVHVMAVHPRYHKKGIGKQLLEVAEKYLRKRNCEFLTVKTLSSAHPSKEYEGTRRFYFSMGFRPVEEFKTLWGETNPCLLMIKALSLDQRTATYR